MNFKLGIVGHPITLANVKEWAFEYFEDVEIFPIKLSSDEDIEEAIPLLNDAMSVCDGILYSCYGSYCVLNGRVTHTVPTRYVNTTDFDFIAAMLKGILKFGMVLDNLSIDSMDYSTALDACARVGIPIEKTIINTFTLDVNIKHFVRETLARHKENCNNGATLCFTNIYAVAEVLEKENIPVTLITPSKESFVKEIRFLMLEQHVQKEKNHKMSAIQISLHYKEKYKLYHNMPLRETNEVANASRILYLFAEGINGAIIRKTEFNFIIIAELQLLKEVTENFVHISLFESIVARTAFNIKIGIGYNNNIKAAFTDSNMALLCAENHTGSNAYVVSNANTIAGPITYTNTKIPCDSDIDALISKIALESNVSFDNINNIYQLGHSNEISIFTSRELAEFLKISVRTANRLIEKLIDSGYAVICGNSSICKKGRPSRIIKILF